jgi:hypothetical protein
MNFGHGYFLLILIFEVTDGTRVYILHHYGSTLYFESIFGVIYFIDMLNVRHIWTNDNKYFFKKTVHINLQYEHMDFLLSRNFIRVG